MTTKTFRSMMFAGAALLLTLPAAAGDATKFAIEDDQVMIGFSASLGGRKQVVGAARSIGGTVQASQTGEQIKLRVPVASLESGSAVIDAALKSALDAEQFPAIELEATAPAFNGSEANLTFAGTMKLHGQTLTVNVPVKLLRDGRLAFVHAVFPISLKAFGVTGPAISGGVVGDRVDVSVDIRLHTLPEGQAVAAF
jgi:polyisoprenoid-binding protein YceI